MNHHYTTTFEFDNCSFDVVAAVYIPAHTQEDDLPEVELLDVSFSDCFDGRDLHEDEIADMIDSSKFNYLLKEQIQGDFS